MLLRPNQTKYNKTFKGRNNNKIELKSNELKFGTYGLKALEKGRITARQIEAVRRTLAGLTKRKSKIWIRVFPDTPVTKKPTEVRMGKGKGNVSYWVCNVKPGKILFEIAGKDDIVIREALKVASNKFPISVKLINRQSI